MRLPAAQASIGYRLEAFDALGSTNDEAMARARAGDPGKLWITAARQSAGRGRLGRNWSSPEGNFYGSLLLVNPAPPDRAPELGFVAGVALIEALKEITGAGARLGLKWPNDVLLDRGKLAGILLEAAQLPNGSFACVAGFGVNCVSHPDGLPYRASDLTEFAIAASREKVFAALAAHFERLYVLWSGGENFSAIREAWLASATGLGAAIEVSNAGQRLSGRFRTIDARGRLLLDAVTGSHAIEAGDINFPIHSAEPNAAPEDFK